MAKKSIDEIVEDKYPTFANMIKDIKSAEEMRKALIIYLRQKEDLLVQKSRDEEIENLKTRKAELSKPYNQMINALKKMMNCIYKFGHKFEGELKQKFEANLVDYQIQLSSIKRQKDEDTTLQAVSEAITELNGEYNESINQLQHKCDYVAFMLKERFDVEVDKVEV